MRKTISLLLCWLLLALPALSLAESSGGLILTGKVEALESVTLYAPFGGSVSDFSLAAGDRVQAGETLLHLDTLKVYAPCDGVIRGIFAQEGDSAGFVQSRYGGLCYLEPTQSLVLHTSTAQGHDSAENRFLHIGETVYLRCTTNSNRSGIGRLIAVNGQSFSVEVTEGNLWIGDSVNIHREAAYGNTSRLGRGVVSRVNPLAITGDGSVLSVAVSEGDAVRRGDLLFEMVSGALEGMSPAQPDLAAPVDGILAHVSVSAGQTVAKNQALLTLYRTDRFKLVSLIDEVEIADMVVGSRASIAFDSLPGKRYEGVIAGISGIGTVSDGYTEYAVTIEFTPDSDVLLGMSGTAYPIP